MPTINIHHVKGKTKPVLLGILDNRKNFNSRNPSKFNLEKKFVFNKKKMHYMSTYVIKIHVYFYFSYNSI